MPPPLIVLLIPRCFHNVPAAMLSMFSANRKNILDKRIYFLYVFTIKAGSGAEVVMCHETRFARIPVILSVVAVVAVGTGAAARFL